MRLVLVTLGDDGTVRWRPVPSAAAAALSADRARWVRFVRGLAEGEGECCRGLAEAFARRVEEAGATEVTR